MEGGGHGWAGRGLGDREDRRRGQKARENEKGLLPCPFSPPCLV